MSLHPKIVQARLQMMLDAVDLPYYGNFLFHISGFHQRQDIKTCAVNITSAGMQFYYNPDFLDSIPQKMVNFIVLHEIYHLLWSHPKRTVSGAFDPKMANIAQDMIINHLLYSDIIGDFIEVPKYPDGKNMAIFLPDEYDGPLIFEYLYDWLKERQEDFLNKKIKMSSNSAGEESDSENEPSEKEKGYGPYGKKPAKYDKGDQKIDTFSLEHIFENIDNTNGEYMDDHIPDTVSEDVRETIISSTIEKLISRGFTTGNNVIDSLNKLRKKRKDHLSYIKKALSNDIFGGKKVKTISKPNRRGIEGLKGRRKCKFKIVVLLDTSGSMAGLFEQTLSYIHRNDIEMDLIETDTEVKWIKKIKSSKGLQSLQIKGLGGTILQPGIDLISQKFNNTNVLILTDGLCDKLDLSKIKGNILIISVNKEVPIKASNGKLKQIVVSKTE